MHNIEMDLEFVFAVIQEQNQEPYPYHKQTSFNNIEDIYIYIYNIYEDENIPNYYDECHSNFRCCVLLKALHLVDGMQLKAFPPYAPWRYQGGFKWLPAVR